MTADPICNERGIPQSECPPFCPHDFGPVGPDALDSLPIAVLLQSRLASWFGDDRQSFLVADLVPVVAQIVAEHQHNALEMARKADLAERRAEEAEYHVEQLRDALDGAERRMERLEADLTQDAEALEELATPDITPSGDMRRAFALAARGLRAALDGSGEPEHCGPDDCRHHWLDRPESDTRECLICGVEVGG